MNTAHTTSKKLKRLARFSLFILAIGIMLMIRQMYADSEPGAIPLLLVVCGLGGYGMARARLRAKRERLA